MSTSGTVLNEYTVPTSGSAPGTITTGPDGNLWFTEETGDKIGMITPTGTITEYTVPTSGAQPLGITAGPDGNLWFTEGDGDKIGEISTTGTITEYPIPTSGADPIGITAGPDGNLWFTEYYGNKIGTVVLPHIPNSPQSFTLTANTSKTIDVVTGVTGSPDPTSLRITTQPSHGTASANSGGTITYTPSANYVGSDSLAYSICSTLDEGMCVSPTINLTIVAATASIVAATTTVKAPDTGIGAAPSPLSSLFVAILIAVPLTSLGYFIARRRLTGRIRISHDKTSAVSH
jgi:virginiamycin B lyase